MTSEKSLQNYLFLSAKNHGVYCRKVMAVGHTGFPDVFLARGGRVVLVELKSPTGLGRLSAKQVRELERICHAGITLYVIDSRDQVDEIIRNLLDA